MRHKSHIAIFSYDGTDRIRFTGLSHKAHSQPDASGSPKTRLCSAIYTYYKQILTIVNDNSVENQKNLCYNRRKF